MRACSISSPAGAGAPRQRASLDRALFGGEVGGRFFILAVGNDSQFQKFCSFAGKPEWAADERFKTNPRG